jgi:hypothetical protein
LVRSYKPTRASLACLSFAPIGALTTAYSNFNALLEALREDHGKHKLVEQHLEPHSKQ